MTKTTLIGIDLAKHVFHLQGVDSKGESTLIKKLNRKKLQEFILRNEPVVFAMEACASAHYWGRLCQENGHQVRLISPQFVKPFVKSNKNDRNDAKAICEAAQRPDMRFVPVKSIEQQAILSIHRIREKLVGQRTLVINQIRGLLNEFGYAIGAGRAALNSQYCEVMESLARTLPAVIIQTLNTQWEHLQQIDERIKQVTQAIEAHAKACPQASRLQTIPGIGPIIASALSATVGDASQFKSGRQMAAWLGLVPRQHSTGGKPRLMGISKRGDGYLRKLLVHGARAVVSHCKRNDPEYAQRRAMLHLLLNKHPNVAVTALANRNARIAWAVMRHERSYDEGFRSKLASQFATA